MGLTYHTYFTFEKKDQNAPIHFQWEKKKIQQFFRLIIEA
jgi:hypothetical protein